MFLVATTLFQALSLFCLSSFLATVDARQSFNFKIGDDVHILSDKAFRKSKEDQYEAVGNVIITHKNDAIYGEKASVSFKTGDVRVVGNVRYVGANMTLYGSKLDYNFKEKNLSVYNTRLLSDNYVVLGKKITKKSNGELVGEDAEYTTCQDCPESWSIFGKNVRITINEYIRIKHAFIKSNGVVVMYIPYIILPIKKNRESGLLFPSFGVDLEDGASFKQGYFWAINDSADMTFTPGINGKRGFAHEYQLRQVFAEDLWYNVNSLQSFDKIYEPFKKESNESGNTDFRFLGSYEHHYFNGSGINHHFNFVNVDDLDVMRDYSKYAEDKIHGAEVSSSGYFDLRSSVFNLSFESQFSRNMLFGNAKGFDHRYVQILPKIKLSSAPLAIFQTKYNGFRKLFFGVDSDYTIFKQNHFDELNYIRNAHRLNLRPYLKLNLGNFGPVSIETMSTLDFQSYNFPYEKSDKKFKKSGILYETQGAIELEKIFGLAYSEKISIDNIVQEKKKENKNLRDDLIGDVPLFSNNLGDEEVTITKSSYRHGQIFKLKHIYLSDQKSEGSNKFLQQIKNEAGQFDPLDSIREKEFQLTNEVSRTSLPLNNTLEFQWNNYITKKSSIISSPYLSSESLRDIFEYSKIAHFNISQGYDFNVQEGDFRNHLTRLLLDTGINFKKSSFGLTEYYYHTTNENILNLKYSREYDYHSMNIGIEYNSFSTPIKKYITTGGSIKLKELLKFNYDFAIDYENKRTEKQLYGILYSPNNNCWKLQLDFEKNLTGKKYGFNFFINFNNDSFTSLSGLGK